jgi:hypothetical protein
MLGNPVLADGSEVFGPAASAPRCNESEHGAGDDECAHRPERAQRGRPVSTGTSRNSDRSSPDANIFPVPSCFIRKVSPPSSTNMM